MRTLILLLPRPHDRLFRAKEGNAAIEFGLIAPVLIIMLMGVVDVGGYAYQRTDLFGAVRAGAQYFVGGGSNLTRAREIVVSSWSQAPDDAAVAVDRFCRCASQEASCNIACADGSLPSVFSRISATSTFRGIFVSWPNNTIDTVRLR